MSSDSAVWWQIEKSIQTLSEWHSLQGRPETALLSRIETTAPKEVIAAHAALLSITSADIHPHGLPSAARRIQQILSAFDSRQLKVMRDRIFADEPSTLDELGRQLDVTRERVRQIEARILGTLLESSEFDLIGRLTTSALDAEQYVAPLAGVLGETPALAEMVPTVDQPLWRVLDRVDSSFEVVDGWWCRNTLREAVIKTKNDLTVAAAGRRYVAISEVKNFEPLPWVPAWLGYCGISIQGGYALLASSGLADRAAVVLEISGAPLQLDLILESLGGERSERSTRNALAADDRFTRVDRSSWALASWGLESYQSIRTLIANELDRNDGSIRLSKLVATLTERFTISSSSVITYAGGLPFVTVDGMVEFATRSVITPKRSPAETRRLFRLQEGWALRIQVTHDHARGSGSVLPSALIPIVGISYGASVVRPCRLGEQRLAWNGSQLTIGSLKKFVDQDGLAVGDTCFAVFGDDGGFDLVKVVVPAESGRSRVLALTGLTMTGTHQQLQDLARSVGQSEVATRNQVIEAFRARGDYDVADSIGHSEW
jgi:hypothetical protein